MAADHVWHNLSPMYAWCQECGCLYLRVAREFWHVGSQHPATEMPTCRRPAAREPIMPRDGVRFINGPENAAAIRRLARERSR